MRGKLKRAGDTRLRLARAGNGRGGADLADGSERPAWGQRVSSACAVWGAACLWAWGYLANLSSALFPDAAVIDSIGIEFAYYTSQLVLVLCALALAVLLRHRHPGVPAALVVGSGVGLSLASVCVTALLRVPDASLAGVIACGAAYGVCGLVLTVAWGARFTLGAGGARRLVLLSFVLAYAIYLVSLYLPAGVPRVLACALPCVSALLWLLDSWRRHLMSAEVWPERGEEGAGLLGEASAGSLDWGLLPWRAMGLFAVCALVGNFVSSFLMGATYEGAAVIFPAGFFVCACITLAALGLVAAGSDRLFAERLFRYCLPFSVLGMLMLLVAPAGSEAFPGALVVGASLFLQVLVVLVVTQATQEWGISPLLSFSAGQGVVAAVVFLGNVGGRAASGLAGAADIWLPVVCAAGVFVLFYLLVMVTDGMAERLGEKGLRWDVDGADGEGELGEGLRASAAGEGERGRLAVGATGAGADGAAGPGGGLAGAACGVGDSRVLGGEGETAVLGAADGAGAASPDNLLADARLEAFAAHLGLTPREAQVCRYLVQGRSLPYIAEQLYVTAGTVKTHALHIYRKAGVSNKQDLISLYTQG